MQNLSAPGTSLLLPLLYRYSIGAVLLVLRVTACTFVVPATSTAAAVVVFVADKGRGRYSSAGINTVSKSTRIT